MLIPILRYPDPLLKRRCEPIKKVNEGIRTLASNMIETMVAADGIGLAAPQIGQSVRLIVVDIWWPASGNNDKALVCINPTIIRAEGQQRLQEGCLSLPGLLEYVQRARKLHVQAQNLDGNEFEFVAEGFLAVAIQHEIDHLDGLLTLDRLSPMSRKLAIKRFI